MSHGFSLQKRQKKECLRFTRCFSRKNTETVLCKKAMWCVVWDRSARGMDCLPSKWEAVIEVDGGYAPE
ncbi:hypothetical protein TNCV_3234231 [Trichonephila clavipes]|nr:hypothetical protein TNCV_3234231 [Trichonephila clavipes]